MKSKVENSGNSSSRDRASAPRIEHREVAPAVFCQDKIVAATLEQSLGKTSLAKSRLSKRFEHQGGNILGD